MTWLRAPGSLPRVPAAVDPHWIAALPKAEVHLHLEGCVPPSVADPSSRSDDPPVFRDLAEILEYLDRSCAQVTRGDQLERIAYATSRRARESGVHHVDVIFNPSHWPAWQHDLSRFVAHLDAGLAAGERDHGVTAGLCLSLTRTQSPSASTELVDWLLDARPARVVALSVDGNEAAAGPTGQRFGPLFARARQAGLHTCAHAGESSGPEGVRDAIDLLEVERVDHGIRAVEDAALVAELAARGIPLDVCPTSNVRLGVVSSMAAHPIEHLRAAGVRVSVNTDDPLLFGTTVAGEYGTCAEAFGWDHATLAGIARTSIESCFANPDRRRALLASLDRYLADPGCSSLES
jgi:adenosine deaminase